MAVTSSSSLDVRVMLEPTVYLVGRQAVDQAEIDRFNLDVSDWEQREYFSIF